MLREVGLGRLLKQHDIETIFHDGVADPYSDAQWQEISLIKFL